MDAADDTPTFAAGLDVLAPTYAGLYGMARKRPTAAGTAPLSADLRPTPKPYQKCRP